MAYVPKETALLRVTNKYHKLYQSLLELVTALNVLEPGGTLLDDVTFTTKEDGRVQVAYAATPIQVTINTPERKLIVRVIENPDGKMPLKRSPVRAPSRSVALSH
jgi:hypothetical protein